jgi:hypothetical protein
MDQIGDKPEDVREHLAQEQKPSGGKPPQPDPEHRGGQTGDDETAAPARNETDPPPTRQ